MGLIPTLITFTPGTDIRASEANANNAAITTAFNGFAVLTDVARTIVAQHTFAPATTQAPFVLGANALGQLVAGLRAATAVTADALTTARTINGVSFDGSANITVPVAGSALTGTTLASNIVASSLTSVGTLTGLTVNGNITCTGTISGGSLSGVSVAASLVTPGTFTANASWRFGAGANAVRIDNTNGRVTLDAMQFRQAFVADAYTGGGSVLFPSTANVAQFSLYTNAASYTIDCSTITEPGVYYVCIALFANVTVTVSGVSWGTAGAPPMPSAVNNILCFQIVNYTTQGAIGDVNAATLLMRNY